jgi:hypothetical protein
MTRPTMIDILTRTAFQRAQRDCEKIDTIADVEFETTAYETDDLKAYADRAERSAVLAAQLMTPAIAISVKTKAELMTIAAADMGAAIESVDAIREAAEVAQALAQTLEAASARLLIALTAVARNQLGSGPTARKV